MNPQDKVKDEELAERGEARDFVAAREARLEVVEQLRLQFVRLQNLRRVVGHRTARIWDLTKRITRLAEDLEEDAVELGRGYWIWGGNGRTCLR